MKAIIDIRIKLKELVDYYTGKEFKGLSPAERGYHLVRAFDQLVGDGWFGVYKPVINYHANGPDEIHIEISEFPPLHFSITIKKEDCNNG